MLILCHVFVLTDSSLVKLLTELGYERMGAWTHHSCLE